MDTSGDEMGDADDTRNISFFVFLTSCSSLSMCSVSSYRVCFMVSFKLSAMLESRFVTRLPEPSTNGTRSMRSLMSHSVVRCDLLLRKSLEDGSVAESISGPLLGTVQTTMGFSNGEAWQLPAVW